MNHHWTWASATRIGTSHLCNGGRVQDAHWVGTFLVHEREFFVTVVADGAGSAEYGGQGASLTCRELSKRFRERACCSSLEDFLPSDDVLQDWVDGVRDRIYIHAKARSVDLRSFASTMILVVSDGERTKVAHIGDGAAVFHSTIDQKWVIPMWPDHGEYASTTNFITDEPDVRLRIDSLEEDIDALCVFTDGLERLALDFRLREPHSPFFEMMLGPLYSSKSLGRVRVLSQSLREFLESPSVNARTDDDKSIVLACRKQV